MSVISIKGNFFLIFFLGGEKENACGDDGSDEVGQLGAGILFFLTDSSLLFWMAAAISVFLPLVYFGSSSGMKDGIPSSSVLTGNVVY